MRVSTGQFQQTSLNTILEQQAKLSKLQQQLGTGRRIVTPADDPAGAAQVLELAAKVDNLEQLKKNGVLAQHRLSMEESVLTQFGDSLQRVRELMLQANNDSTTAEDRRLIAAELKEIGDGLVQLANSDDGNGEYLFGGTASRNPPFEVDNGVVRYRGNQAERLVQVGPSRQLPVNHNGYDVFMKIPRTDGDAPRSVFAMVNELTELLAGAQDDEAWRADMHTRIEGYLGEIDQAQEVLLDKRAEVGARLRAIESEANLADDAIVELKSARSKLEDLDYASAISQLSLQLTGLQAAQLSYAKIQGLSLFNYL